MLVDIVRKILLTEHSLRDWGISLVTRFTSEFEIHNYIVSMKDIHGELEVSK